MEGVNDGDSEGEQLGVPVGTELGSAVGNLVGSVVLGPDEGFVLGLGEGGTDGVPVG